MAITGIHALIYSKDAPADRAFLRDVLGFPHVDDGDGWLIFKLPPAELGVHPDDREFHELYLMCDDIDATLAELRHRGAVILDGPTDRGFGVLATLRLPGGGALSIYEPRHAQAITL
jgi:catechol 2,3-dioxygenase-like lactoylglutathione lyase family enzyme